MRRLFVFAAFVFLLAIPGHGLFAAGVESLEPWQKQLPIIQKDELQRDVDVLETTYGALHPGLHRYLDNAKLDAMYAALRKQFSRQTRLDEAFLAYSAFAARIGCGHTYTNFFNQSGAVQKALFQHPRLPFLFRWIDGEMVVTRDLGSGIDLKPGTRIVGLDGLRTRTLLAALMPYARADGSNDHKRVADLQRSGSSRYEAFDIYYPLLYPETVSDTARIRFIAPGTRRRQTATIRKLAYSAESPLMQRSGVATDSPLGWTLTYPRHGVAVMRMPDWAAYKHPDFDWQTYVDRAFEAFVAQDVHELVIDLRGNEGGDNIGSVLLSHIIDRPLAPAIAGRSVRYRQVPDALRPNLSTWDESFYDWGQAVAGPENGFYRLTKYDTGKAGIAIAPKVPRFTGRVWVVVGSDNSSATFEFAQTVQLRKLGVLVGEPTGGNQRGVNGGAFFFMTLPGSGIELDVPLIAQFPATPMPDAGILPDILVPETAHSIATGSDVALETIFARIERD